MSQALQRLAKWRSVFAGWQLGTRAKGDPESDAVRDHREVTVLLRAENNAILRVLQEKEIVTPDEFAKILDEEATWLSDAYSRKFPGFTATDYGMSVDTKLAAETTKGWRP